MRPLPTLTVVSNSARLSRATLVKSGTLGIEARSRTWQMLQFCSRISFALKLGLTDGASIGATFVLLWLVEEDCTGRGSPLTNFQTEGISFAVTYTMP